MPNYYIKESSDKPCPMRKYLDFGASGFAIITTLLPLIVFFLKKSWDILGNVWDILGKCLIFRKLFIIIHRLTCTEAQMTMPLNR